jgi:hypothetical protein
LRFPEVFADRGSFSKTFIGSFLVVFFYPPTAILVFSENYGGFRMKVFPERFSRFALFSRFRPTAKRASVTTDAQLTVAEWNPRPKAPPGRRALPCPTANLRGLGKRIFEFRSKTSNR